MHSNIIFLFFQTSTNVQREQIPVHKLVRTPRDPTHVAATRAMSWDLMASCAVVRIDLELLAACMCLMLVHTLILN